MTVRAFVSALLFLGLALPTPGQDGSPSAASNPAAAAAPAASPVFEVVDVHASPHPNFMRITSAGRLVGERYTIRQATMPQLIAAAYDEDSSAVTGGPTWLDMERYDVTAKAPAGTPPATLKLMMRAMLKDRFKLAVHEGTAPMPAYVLRVAKGQPNLKESDGTTDSACNGHPSEPSESGVVQILMSCHNETMEKFAHFLAGFGGAGYLNQPVVDSTGLKPGYDFDLKWTPQMLLAKAGADGITLFDALEKQLGLKLALETAPRPVLIVDSVNETPTPNAPGVEKLLPAAPARQFEVSTIRPSKPDTRENGGIRGGMVNVQGMTLKELISFAWDINPIDTEGLVNAPAWLDKDKFDIVAKVAGDDAANGSAKAPEMDIEELQELLRGLIAERFKMQTHTEPRPVTAYALVAAGPKIKPAADPTSRMNCKEGVGPDGKDPRTTYPVRNRLMWCQNMTMTEFAKQLQYVANGFIYYPVVDRTGLKGGFDFSLNFSSVQQMMPGSGGGGGGSGAGSAAGSPAGNSVLPASDPNGALSLFDAVKTELGLRLEKEKRTEQVLVIDHIEEQPTEN